MPTKDFIIEVNHEFLPVRLSPKRKTWPPYQFAKLMINALAPDIITAKQYREWIRLNSIVFLPTNPQNVYEGFKWRDYLGSSDLTPMQVAVRARVNRVEPRDMWEAIKWAQQYCHENRIHTTNQWRREYDETKIPKDIPKYPEKEYKNKFPGFDVWLGKKTIAKLDANTHVSGVLTLLHVTGQPSNIVALRVWSNGLGDLRENWSKQREFDRVLGQWKYEHELMSQVTRILDTLGSKGDLYWTIPNMNEVLWELNSLLMIVR